MPKNRFPYYVRLRWVFLLLVVILPCWVSTARMAPAHVSATGAVWMDLSSHVISTRGTPNFSSVVFIGQEGWIGSGNFPEVYHTRDGGATFEVQTLPTEVNALAMRSITEGYAGGQNGRIYRTTDGGASWQSLGSTGNPVRGLSCPPSGAACYSVGDHGSTTIITGTVLTANNTGLASNLHSVHFPIDSNEGWLCGGAIIRHFSGGAWQGDQTYPTNGYNAIAFSDQLNGWAVGDHGVIAYTSDGGKVGLPPLAGWHLQTNPDPGLPQRTLNGIYALHRYDVWAVGNGGVILHTLTASLLTAVHAEDGDTVYVVGTNGTLLKYTTSIIPLDQKIYLPFVIRAMP